MNYRELKYVLLGDDRLSSKLRNVSQAGDKAANSLRHSSNRLTSFKRNMHGVAQEIPMLGRAMRLATNPIVLGTAALGGLAVAYRKASNEAATFNSNFRELANLNLNMSHSGIRGMKSDVLTTAFNKGFDASQTSKAYYDVQSVSGLVGGRVSKFVESQGDFAKVMQADFNAWIEGSAKAMANYGFGVDELERFNRAAYATVKVGSITFDQLAKVQSSYAGAASSAKQSFETANKMLTVFTVKTKSADEAATLTKSLFNDLTKKSTQEALKNVGIDLYDASDRIKQADVLMRELNEKFVELGDSDRKIMNLKNEFKGSEGLTQFIQAATENSGQLVNTLNQFDSTELGFNKALKLAKTDINYINEQLENRTKVLLAQLGEGSLEFKVRLAELKLGAQDAFMFYSGISNDPAKQGAYSAKKEFDWLAWDGHKLSDKEYSQGMKSLMEDITYWQNIQSEASSAKKRVEKFTPNNYLFKGMSKIPGLENIEKEYLSALQRFMIPQQYHDYEYSTSKLRTLFNIQSLAQQAFATKSAIPRPGGIEEKSNNDDEDPYKKGSDSIAGGGNAIRNITVNITKLIESQNINTKNITEGQADIQRLVEEALMRAIAGTEQMMQ